ncbi:hypothetical protein [Agromyces seonyuensis]|uniref:DNA modification methylase n=1 Tax=Agromyces seonyuensis TaxID=2662446 RepID=A0A6I4P342_9MICO|nr:hypothetical protein [Agromyces seonyuensis]MWB97717.1 hypothetical protein [Agromyces seonyuensis]
MKARLAASVLLAAGIALGASGCTFVTYQATTEKYEASDGVNLSVGDLEVRNALVITDDGEDAVLAVSIANDSDSDVTLGIEYEDETVEVEVPAGTMTVFGGSADDAEPAIELPGLGADAGSLTPLYFQYGGEEGVEKLVPVLDGTLPEYEDLLG